jgi:hypothetical protein
MDAVLGAGLIFDPTLVNGKSVGYRNGPDSQLPELTSSFNLSWTVNSADLLATPAPAVGFDDIKLNFGEFVHTFLGDVLNPVEKLIAPITNILDKLKTALPLISTISEALSFLGGGNVYDIITNHNSTIDDFLNAVGDLTNLVDLVNNAGADDYSIDLGSLDFGDKDLRLARGGGPNALANDGQDALGQLNSPGAIANEIADPVIKQYLGSSSPKDGLSLPILQDPSSIVGMLFGRNANLVAFDLTPIDATFNLASFPIPLFAPPPIFADLDFSVDLEAHLHFGYDTYGIAQFAQDHNSADLQRGFYIDSTKGPALGFTLNMGFGPEVDVGFVSAKIEAQFGANVSLNIADPAGSFVGYRGVPNLAVNGSFESGLAGWTATSGGSATSNGPRAWDGSSVFLAAAGTQPVVQQTVDLVAAGFSTTALDSGSLQIAFGGRALLQQSSLSATASLVFFDQDGHPVGSTAVAPAGSDTGRWLRMFDTVDVPFGARSVELILGASGSAAFDAAFVGVITRGTSVDQGSGPMVAMPGDTTSGRLALRAPDLYVDWELNQPKFITWDSFGAATGQPVRIELWQDGPSGPAFRSVIAASAPDTGQFSWTPSSSGLTYGDHGLRVRIVGIANPSIYDMSTETFTVPQAGNVYYVNDAITTGDEYTTAIGSNRNTGKSPDSPKPNPDNLFRTYADLGAGSVVYVDTGSYPLIAPLQLSGTTDHGLGLHQGFQIIGPANASDAALLFPAIAGTGPAVIELDNSSFVTLRNLTLENSVDGLLIHNGSVNFTLSGITALNNSGDGILIQANSPTSTLTNITTGYSGGVGIEIDGSIASLDGLDSFDNTTGLLISGSIGRISSAVITANRQYGMDLSLGMDTVIEGSSISGNMVGVRINSANSATVIFGDADLSAGLGNIVTHNRLDGVDATGHVIVAGNTISDNGINGIVLNGPATAQANVVFGNTNGIIGGTGTQILYNQIYQNSGSGIVAAGSAVTATGNVIFSNNFGVSTSIFADHLTLSNNLVYANQTAAVTALASNLEVLNNTFYQVVGDVLDVNGAIAVDVRNNIIVALSGLGIAVSNASQAGFSSNYNLFNTGPSGRVGQWQGTRATLLQWQIASQLDANSIFGDPGFVSAAGPDGIVGYSAALNGSDDDFHEMSAYGTPVGGTLAVVLDPTSGLPVRPAGTLTNFATSSPAIDRGDPSVPVGAEPAPNGNFINIGAYGGTTQAARSASTYIRVVTPDGGETIGQGSTYAVTWRSAGFPGTVDLELFGTENDTSGAIPIATGVPNSGIYEWTVDPATVPLGVYRMQVSESADPHLAGISDSLFHAPDPFLLCQ